MSHSDLRLHFGLGQAERVDRLEVRWPSGAVQVLRDIAADQVLTGMGRMKRDRMGRIRLELSELWVNRRES